MAGGNKPVRAHPGRKRAPARKPAGQGVARQYVLGMFDIRPAADDDREDLARLIGFAFNFNVPPEAINPVGKLCAVGSRGLLGTAGVLPFEQWFGGQAVSCAGIGSVAVSPEARGSGVATQLMSAALSGQRQAARAVSALYPANAQLYRKLGYEYGGIRAQLAVPLPDLPGAKATPVREAGPGDTAALMDCFARYASGHNGPVSTSDEAYFSERVLAHSGEGVNQRTVLVEGPGGVEGYASFFTTRHERAVPSRVTCKHLVACTPGALAALLAYFARFVNAIEEFAWYEPPHAPVMAMSLSSHAFAVTTEVQRWMTRLLDVPAALEGRGYPPVSGRLALSVDDPLFPENAGPWLLEADGGKVRVSPGESSSRPIPVGTLSALYTGQASPGDLVLAGALEADDERLSLMAALFSGPAPWMPNFF